MRYKIKKIIRESLGVPSGINQAAKLLYDQLIQQTEYVEEVSDSNEYQFEIKDNFTISDFSFEGVDVTIKCHENEDYPKIELLGLSVKTEGKLKDRQKPVISYITPSILNVNLMFLVPKDNWDFNDIHEYIVTHKSDLVSSISHEFKHSYDHFKKNLENPSVYAEYNVFSNIRLGIPPLDEFSHLMYFIHSTENLTRASELSARLEVENISRSEFLSFLKSTKIYQNLKKAQSFTYEGLKKELMNYIPKIDEVLIHLNEDTSISDDEKIERIMDLYVITLINAKGSSLQDLLVTNPFEAILGLQKNKRKYFEDFIRKITKLDSGKKFFEYQEKFFKFVANKMIKKISKLYAMLNESIVDWEMYHKVVKPKYQGFVKESKFFKVKNNGKSKNT